MNPMMKNKRSYSFTRLRSSDMEKLAESKFGQNNENAVLEKCQKLGAAIVTFDLMKIKHFNAIDLDKLVPTASAAKGAAFVLYNFARLHTLLATFDQQVARGFYAPLPDFDEIDFGLLKTEVCHFCLLFCDLIAFQSILMRSIHSINEFHLLLIISIYAPFIMSPKANVNFILFFIYHNRKNGRCFMFTLWASHQCWSVVSTASKMVKLPFICCAHF